MLFSDATLLPCHWLGVGGVGLGGAEWFAAKKTRNGVPCLSTLVVSMVCRKITKAQSQFLGAHTKGGAVDLQLLQGIQIWQWKWHDGNCKDFLSLTGRALSKRFEEVRRQKQRQKTTTVPDAQTL